jgi:hypothetical protein
VLTDEDFLCRCRRRWWRAAGDVLDPTGNVREVIFTAATRGRKGANFNAVLNDVHMSTEQFTLIRIDVALTQTLLKIAQTNHRLFDAGHNLRIVVGARPQSGDVGIVCVQRFIDRIQKCVRVDPSRRASVGVGSAAAKSRLCTLLCSPHLGRTNAAAVAEPQVFAHIGRKGSRISIQVHVTMLVTLRMPEPEVCQKQRIRELR